MADRHEATTTPRKRSRIRTFLLTLTAVIVFIVAGLWIAGESYHGPRDLAAVTAMMPGVPIFPLADMAPGNRTTQRLMAIPLYLMRRGLQGEHRAAEAVLLRAPADPDYVLDWYRRAAPYQDWKKLQVARLNNSTRLVFLRNHEVLQVIVGHSTDGLVTPIQLIYLNGVSDVQITRLQAEGRVGVQ
jgi:hypothetical protein